MKSQIVQANPYQVRNKRFHRTNNENEPRSHSSISHESQPSSISNKLIRQIEPLNIDKKMLRQNMKSLKILKFGIKESEENPKIQERVKNQLKRTNSPVRKKQDYRAKFEELSKLLIQKDKKIQQLQKLLALKSKETNILTQKINRMTVIQQQKNKQQMIQKEQHNNDATKLTQENYKLRNITKKLQIQLNCCNKKWSESIAKISKQKDDQIKKLRVMLANLLRSNRQKSKTTSVISQHSPINSLLHVQSQIDYENELQLSSFELSR